MRCATRATRLRDFACRVPRIEKMKSSRQIAETATFQSFANCYLREVNPGVSVMHRTAGGACDSIEWSLSRQQMLLRVEVTSSSLCGPLHFGRAWGRHVSDPSWRPIELMSALHMLVQAAYRQDDTGQTDALRGFERASDPGARKLPTDRALHRQGTAWSKRPRRISRPSSHLSSGTGCTPRRRAGRA